MNWPQFSGFFTQPLFTLGHTEVSLATLVWGAALLVLLGLLARFIRQLLRRRILAHTHLSVGLQYLISRIVGYGVFLIGLLVVMQTMGINLSSLAVIGGALGIGIGFGLQNTVNNFVSGLILMGERSIQIGDRVEVGGTLGRVTRIGARATAIETNDNISIIVPNSEFVSTRVVNWSLQGDQRVRLRLPVGVAYSSDPHRVEQLLIEVAAANPHVLKEPPPQVVFREFGDSSLNFELRVWTVDMTHHPGVLRSELNFAIWDKLKEHGIEIPFPQRDLHVKEPVKVELTERK